MVAFGDADLGEGAVAAVAGQDQRGDAGGIGLEGEEEHVIHDLDVLFKTGGDANRRLDVRIGDVLEPLGLFNALFDTVFRRKLFKLLQSSNQFGL